MSLPAEAVSAPMTIQELRARLADQPRVPLAHLPTPLDDCPRLTKALGGPRIMVKRDDMTGLAFGGNKTRTLEYLFADIVASGADVVVAGAYTQSNWCRQITAAARRLGLDVALVLVHGEKGPRLQGNLLLDRLMGADVTVVDIPDMEHLAAHMEAKVAELAAAGRQPYLVAPFNVDLQATAALGYVDGLAELAEQLSARRIHADALYLAAANITPAGLEVGARALGLELRVVGITPIQWSEDRPTDIARIANATAERLGLDMAFAPDDIANDDGYIGERYGVVSDACREAIRLVAETEGLILDPVYTGKAMAGLIDHIRQGRLGADETVVFLHTGGLPALFAYDTDLGFE